MNATKILWGQVLVVGTVVLAFVWAATEWVAWRLGFQPQLGQAWFELIGWPVYQPPAFFWWWFAYDAYARPIFVEGAYIAASGGIAAIVVAVAMSVWRAREVKKVTTYGSARWAETREVRRTGLLQADGVLLGRWRGAYLRHDGPEHVLCFAPTRSGKGVGLVVPTLLTWPPMAILVAFDKHYIEAHVPIAKKIPGLRKYEVSQGPVATPGGPSTARRRGMP
jgi:type IV secretion system protein VirD4